MIDIDRVKKEIKMLAHNAKEYKKIIRNPENNRSPFTNLWSAQHKLYDTKSRLTKLHVLLALRTGKRHLSAETRFRDQHWDRPISIDDEHRELWVSKIKKEFEWQDSLK